MYLIIVFRPKHTRTLYTYTCACTHVFLYLIDVHYLVNYFSLIYRDINFRVFKVIRQDVIHAGEKLIPTIFKVIPHTVHVHVHVHTDNGLVITRCCFCLCIYNYTCTCTCISHFLLNDNYGYMLYTCYIECTCAYMYIK